MSEVVKSYFEPETEEARRVKHVTQSCREDVPHLDPSAKAQILASTPYQRDARTKGIPQSHLSAVGVRNSGAELSDAQALAALLRVGCGLEADGRALAGHGSRHWGDVCLARIFPSPSLARDPCRSDQGTGRLDSWGGPPGLSGLFPDGWPHADGNGHGVAGIAPVIRQSGDTQATRCRQAYPRFFTADRAPYREELHQRP